MFKEFYFQKQPSIGVLIKRCSENKQQIYWRHPCQSVISIKCDFLWICCIFSEHFFPETPLEGCFCILDVQIISKYAYGYKIRKYLKYAHRSKHLKDTHTETEALTKSMNMYIWVIGTLNQLFIGGSYNQVNLQKMKGSVAKVYLLW